MMRSGLAAGVLATVFLGWGCSDDTVSTGDSSRAGDANVTKADGGGGTADKPGTPPSDGVSTNQEAQVTPPPGTPGAVCTQENQNCGAGLKCAFLEAWNAPKGTCLTIAEGGCTAWNDPRCAVAGKNYSVMCGEYTYMSVTTNVCFLLCSFNGQSYDCPPLHTCKTINGEQTCVPQ